MHLNKHHFIGIFLAVITIFYLPFWVPITQFGQLITLAIIAITVFIINYTKTPKD
jgi:hypothetical protein